MVHTPAWRNFRRAVDGACVAASLIYAGAALNAWVRLPGEAGLKLGVVVAFPLAFLMATLLVALSVKPARQVLSRYIWLTFVAGFGQKPASIMIGVGFLCGAGFLMYHQVETAAGGGRYPAGVFSAYGAGIGVLFAQAALLRALQRAPEVRPLIEAAD
jgi:hypothetical protein